MPVWPVGERKEGKKSQGCAEGVAAMALVTGLGPEVGPGPGPRVGGSSRVEDSSESSLEPQAPDYNVPRQGGRGGGPDVHAPLHLSTVKPLGIYLSLSVSGCARLCLCELHRLCVCACLCLCMYLGLCLRVCGCWSVPVCMAVSCFVCVSMCAWDCGAPCVLDSMHVKAVGASKPWTICLRLWVSVTSV